MHAVCLCPKGCGMVVVRGGAAHVSGSARPLRQEREQVNSKCKGNKPFTLFVMVFVAAWSLRGWCSVHSLSLRSLVTLPCPVAGGVASGTSCMCWRRGWCYVVSRRRGWWCVVCLTGLVSLVCYLELYPRAPCSTSKRMTGALYCTSQVPSYSWKAQLVEN